MNRSEHLAWAKSRALEYIDNGDVLNAVASIMSDLRKHEELANHPGIALGLMEMMGLGARFDCGKAKEWIEGFN